MKDLFAFFPIVGLRGFIPFRVETGTKGHTTNTPMVRPTCCAMIPRRELYFLGRILKMQFIPRRWFPEAKSGNALRLPELANRLGNGRREGQPEITPRFLRDWPNEESFSGLA